MHNFTQLLWNLYGRIFGWGGVVAPAAAPVAYNHARAAGRGWILDLRSQIKFAILVPIIGLSAACLIPSYGSWITGATGILCIYFLIRVIVTGSLPFFIGAAFHPSYTVNGVMERVSPMITGTILWVWLWFFSASLSRAYTDPRWLAVYLAAPLGLWFALVHFEWTRSKVLEWAVVLFFGCIVCGMFVIKSGAEVYGSAIKPHLEAAAEIRAREASAPRAGLSTVIVENGSDFPYRGIVSYDHGDGDVTSEVVALEAAEPGRARPFKDLRTAGLIQMELRSDDPDIRAEWIGSYNPVTKVFTTADGRRFRFAEGYMRLERSGHIVASLSSAKAERKEAKVAPKSEARRAPYRSPDRARSTDYSDEEVSPIGVRRVKKVPHTNRHRGVSKRALAPWWARPRS